MNSNALQRRAPAIAAVVALALVALMVTRTSQAAFSDTTDNTGNSFTAGTIELVDDDAGAAMFTVADMSPGDSQTGCIQVTYNGSIATPSAVKLYSGGYVDVAGPDLASAGLSGYLTLTVVEGAAGATCAVFSPGATIVNASTIAAFGAASTDYLSGVGGWTPAASGETVAYQFTVALDAATPNAEQGASTNSVGFVWEVQS